MNSVCTIVIPDIVYLRKLYNMISTKAYLANIKAHEAHSLGTIIDVQTEGILKDVDKRHKR